MRNLRDLKIYLTSSVYDAEQARELRKKLVEAGFCPFWAEEDIPLGASRLNIILDEVEDFDVILICLSTNSARDSFFDAETSALWAKKKLIIPIHLDTPSYSDLQESINIYLFLKNLEGIHYYLPGGFEKLAKGLSRVAEGLPDKSPAAPSARQRRGSLIVKKLALSNIRCLENLELDLGTKTGPTSLIVILGDNAAGKSTLLRCLALGLCSEGDTTALLKQMPGKFIREGAEEAAIRVELWDPQKRQNIVITTQLTKVDADEVVRKRIEAESFQWDDLFVCAYGTNRSRHATASYDVYNLHEALRPLFDDTVTLKNPELVLLREEPKLRAELERRLLRILMLDEPENRIDYRRTGAYLHGPWGDQPINTLSDGYRSTAQWVIDFLGWAIYAGRINGKGEAGGILIVDEIEQHLHPLWQRHVIQRLHQQLPTTQIFVSTHTPLIVSGAVDVEGACLVRLKMHEDGSVEKVMIHPESLANLRADQVLATEAFGLVTTRNPGSETEFDRYATLLGKESRSEVEEQELEKLRSHLKKSLAPGETEWEREVGLAIETVLKARKKPVNPELYSAEVKKQLREIFRNLQGK